MMNKILIKGLLFLTFLVSLLSCENEGTTITNKTEITEKGLPSNINLWGNEFQKELDAINFQDISLRKKNKDLKKTISGLNKLSDNHLKIITSIAYALKKTKSYKDFEEKMLKVNTEIYKIIPISEQESWLYLTAYFQHGMEYIHNNKEKIKGRFNKVSSKHKNLTLTAFNRGDIYGPCIESDTPNECMELAETLYYMYFIAIVEPTPFGEAIAAIVTIYYGSIVFDQLVDLIMERSECIEIYAYECKENGNAYCSDCLQTCIIQGDWPYYKCP